MSEADCIDFDPYEVRVDSKDVTKAVIVEESSEAAGGLASLTAAEGVLEYGTTGQGLS